MSIKEKAIDTIFNTATGNSTKRTLLTPLVGGMFVIVTSLFVIVPLMLDAIFHIPKLWSVPFNYIFSIPVISGGLIFMIWSIFYYIKFKGTPVPVNPPPKLITTGPFAFSRNPMHGGLFLIMFGLGIYFSSILSVFLFTPLYILIDVWFLKSIEEPELVKRLGNEYIEYRKRTPMFLGWKRK